jgi:hypothetical protein
LPGERLSKENALFSYAIVSSEIGSTGMLPMEKLPASPKTCGQSLIDVAWGKEV